MNNDWGISDPQNFNLDSATADPNILRNVICYLNDSGNEYDGNIGARVSSIFVIGAVSTFVTFFPVVAKRVPSFHIPLYVYLFARYFGAGVIVATAFIHLLDPAYGEIGPATCVGLTAGWVEYSWPPAICLTSAMLIFLLDSVAERYVEQKYGVEAEQNLEGAVTGKTSGQDQGARRRSSAARIRDTAITNTRQEHLTRNANEPTDPTSTTAMEAAYERKFREEYEDSDNTSDETARHFAVQQQFAAFLILEFGVIFHSVIIGLNLGVSGSEFSTLYVVLVFHQSFEGLGIGARLSTIPFRKGSWVPWLLCSLYGITTPISIAIGIGLRTTYNSGSFTANVVSGVLDSISAGILVYTGLVELLARDFLFNPARTRDNKRLAFMMGCVFLGAGIMALLGKWA